MGIVDFYMLTVSRLIQQQGKSTAVDSKYEAGSSLMEATGRKC